MCISIITPVYNESDNLVAIYNNLCQQVNIKFEWVVIDDGSKDNSIEILENIISLHNNPHFNIKLIKQSNTGASIARRHGIGHASYEVVTILDADDKLSDDGLWKAYKKLNENIDIVCYRVNYCLPSGDVKSEFQYTPKAWPIVGIDAFSECISAWGLTGWFMARKSLFIKAYSYTDTHLLGNTVNGDELVSRLCMYYARAIDICDGIYSYYLNPSSTTRKINDKFYRTIYTALALNKFIIDNCDENLQRKSQRHLLATLWSIYIRYNQWRCHIKNKDEWLTAMKKIANEINILALLKAQDDPLTWLKTWVKTVLVIYFKAK